MTRERLIGLLWSDRDEAQARHVLAQSLYALRKDLGAESCCSTAARFGSTRPW
jgi:DNA-binding SARP family transcriptional activator